MKKLLLLLQKHPGSIGPGLILLGCLLLLVSFLVGWTGINAVQLAGLFLVLAGLIVHVALLKRQSRY